MCPFVSPLLDALSLVNATLSSKRRSSELDEISIGPKHPGADISDSTMERTMKLNLNLSFPCSRVQLPSGFERLNSSELISFAFNSVA